MNRRNFIQQGSFAALGVTLAQQNAHMINQEDPMVLGHQKKYRLDTEWGKLDFSRYPVKDCHEMIQDKKGRIFLLTNETRNNVIIYSRKGKLLKTWGTEYPGAHGLTLSDENGDEFLFICDNKIGRAHV